MASVRALDPRTGRSWVRLTLRSARHRVVLKWHVRALCVRALVVGGCGILLASCEGAQGVRDRVARFSLEVVNRANTAVRMQINMGHSVSMPEGRVPRGYTGILDLDKNAKQVFQGGTLGAEDSAADNQMVRGFEGIFFYEHGADIPYVAYTYRPNVCSYAHASSIVGDDSLCLYDIALLWWDYGNSERAFDRLFVESPDRPFYLELDEEDHDLARVVIRSVPSPEKVSGSSAIPEPAARFGLELVNAAGARVGVQIGMGAARFRRPVGGDRRDYSGVVFLDGNEERAFELGVYGADDSAADNEYVREFKEIFFYAPGADTPFVGYAGGYHGCLRAWLYFGRDTPCVYDEDDEWRESLFRESADRPFYLERDRADRDLARLVITFVPGEGAAEGRQR